MQKLLEAGNYCAIEKAKPSHYEYVMNYESPSHAKLSEIKSSSNLHCSNNYS